MLKKCYFEQVLFSYPVDNVDFEKVILYKVLLCDSANAVAFKKVLHRTSVILCDLANTVDFTTF